MRAHVEQVDEKVVGQLLGLLGEDAVLGLSGARAQRSLVLQVLRSGTVSAAFPISASSGLSLLAEDSGLESERLARQSIADTGQREAADDGLLGIGVFLCDLKMAGLLHQAIFTVSSLFS